MIKENFQYKSKDISLYLSDDLKAKTILLISYENGEIEKVYQELNRSDFNLIGISNINWNDDLSPFYHKMIYKGDKEYKGNANEFLKYIKEELLPFIFNKYNLKPKSLAIAGYSLAGLFSIYSAYNCDIFDSIISMSGSLWFTDFIKYVENKNISKNVKYIYLSLGDKEAKTKNEYLKEVENKTIAIYNHFKNLGINTVYKTNSGGHFNDVINRIVMALNEYLNKD